jgi:hypothetical protein
MLSLGSHVRLDKGLIARITVEDIAAVSKIQYI